VNPSIKGKDLNTEQVKKIIINAEKVLNDGITQGGSSMKDKMYTDIYGNYGNYQNNFKIYERENCIKCKNSIIKIKIKGRASYYCSKCQPIDI
jgi:formamidopyrimidine-DNA glycosylase